MEKIIELISEWVEDPAKFINNRRACGRELKELIERETRRTTYEDVKTEPMKEDPIITPSTFENTWKNTERQMRDKFETELHTKLLSCILRHLGKDSITREELERFRNRDCFVVVAGSNNFFQIKGEVVHSWTDYDWQANSL